MEVVITQHVSVLNAAALHTLKGYWLVLWLYEFYLNQKKKNQGVAPNVHPGAGEGPPLPAAPSTGIV